MAEERQVADKIQDFMADEFIPEAEGSADDFLFIEDDGVIQASSESQTALPEPGSILQEPKRSGRSYFFEEELPGQGEGYLLPADERMGKINGTRYSEVRVRKEGQSCPFLLDGVRLENPDRLYPLRNRQQTGLKDGRRQGSCASVQDRDFPALKLELDAGEAKNMQDCQEMLQGLNPARSKDQAGAVQGLNHPGIDLNLQPAQVHPSKKEPAIRGGFDGQAGQFSRVNPHAGKGNGPLNRPLLDHFGASILQIGTFPKAPTLGERASVW